jgi:site-specific recombinase XerD
MVVATLRRQPEHEPSDQHSQFPDDRSAVAAFHAYLELLNFVPRRIERDLKAVHQALEALGPLESWSSSRIECYTDGRDRARKMPQRAVPAVWRFFALACEPEEFFLQAEFLEAWRNRHVVQNYKPDTANKRRDGVLHFVDEAGPVWRARATDMDRYGAARRSAGVARETLRSDQIAVRSFIEFLMDPLDDWAEQLHEATGARVRQICRPENTLTHLRDCPEGAVGRAFLSDELNQFFSCIEARMERAHARKRKGYWTSWRDHAMFGVMLATGGRDGCLASANVTDLLPAYSAIARFSPYEQLEFRGKSSPGGPKKPRIVYAYAYFRYQWRELHRYVCHARAHLVRSGRGGDALFLGERGERITANEIASRFREIADEAGLSKDLHAHCLRHTFAAQLRMMRVDIPIIKHQLGHSRESTTARYAKVTDEYIKERMLECGRRRIRERYALT